MTISRSLMERQLRAGGGIMTLEEPRQGYFLGKIVKKAKRAVKKVIKSPVGKAALLAGGAYLAGGYMPGGGGITGGLANFRNFGSGVAGLFDKGRFLSPLVRNKAGEFSLGRAALTGLGAASIAAPFFMGGDEEEVVEDTPFSTTPDSIASIVNMAKNQDPSLRFLPKPKFVDNFYAADGGIARTGYNMGGPTDGGVMMASNMQNDEILQNLYEKFLDSGMSPEDAAEAARKLFDQMSQQNNIPRVEARLGGIMNSIKGGINKVRSLFDDANVNIAVRDADVMTDAGPQAQAIGQDVFITPKSAKAMKVMDGLIEEGYDITKSSDGSYTINALDEGAFDIITKKLRLGGKDIDDFMGNFDSMYSSGDDKIIADALRNRKAEGGIMDAKRGFVDGPGGYAGKKGKKKPNMAAMTQFEENLPLYTTGFLSAVAPFIPFLKEGGRVPAQEGGLMNLGGLEKDYREGGFVPLGAEERADDVPARLSKNEFVFTADAVRNAGDGDIDKGAEVMQNMMDNLESGGTISEESQGEENPAQEMFDQSQQLENRLA
jgi:hypothetical protein